MTAAAVVRPLILLFLSLIAHVAVRVHFTATCLIAMAKQSNIAIKSSHHCPQEPRALKTLDPNLRRSVCSRCEAGMHICLKDACFGS